MDICSLCSVFCVGDSQQRVSTWVFDFYLSGTFQREHIEGPNLVLTGAVELSPWLTPKHVSLSPLTHTPNDRFPCTFVTPSMLFCVHPSCVLVFLKDWFVMTSLVSSHRLYHFNFKALPYKFSFYRLALASGTPRTHFGTIVESDMPLGILGCFAAWGMIDVPPVIEGEMISEKGKATLPPQSQNYVLCVKYWQSCHVGWKLDLRSMSVEWSSCLFINHSTWTLR